MMKFWYFCIVLFFSINVLAQETKGQLKEGFVFVDVIDPSIIVQLRYCSKDNFTGHKILKCNKKQKAILTQEAANALSEVQRDLALQGYGLVLYDAYRPKSSYLEMIKWSESKDYEEIGTDAVKRKKTFYPHMLKSQILKSGFLREKLEHTRGSTVDVGLVALSKDIKQRVDYKTVTYSLLEYTIFDDGTLDMGSHYDLLDAISSFDAVALLQEHKDNRYILRKAMQSQGFIPSNKFWWQYTLAREPYADTEFDFDINYK